jgi:hypothetical protein
MLFIDSAQLRAAAARLAELRDDLVPGSPGTAVDTGFAALTAACVELAEALSAARLRQASCLQRLANGVNTAANQWDSADALPAR